MSSESREGWGGEPAQQEAQVVHLHSSEAKEGEVRGARGRETEMDGQDRERERVRKEEGAWREIREPEAQKGEGEKWREEEGERK